MKLTMPFPTHMKQLMNNAAILIASAVLLTVFGSALIVYLVYLTIRKNLTGDET